MPSDHLPPIVKNALRHYRYDCRRFRDRTLSTPWLSAFLAAAFLSQIAVGYRLGGQWWTGLLYPLGNLLFLSVACSITIHFSERAPKSRARLERPHLQLALVLMIVAIHYLWLLPQFPDPAVAGNPISGALGRLVRPIAGLTAPISEIMHASGETATRIASSFLNVVLFVLLPLLILLPFTRTADAFELRRFDWRLPAALACLYLPFLAQGVTEPHSLLVCSAIYLFEAALPEEFLYRALLQTRLEAFFKDRLAPVAIAALVFGFMHLPINSAMHGWPLSVAFCVGANAFGGFLLGYVYYRTGSLWLAVLLHAWAGIATGGAGCGR